MDPEIANVNHMVGLPPELRRQHFRLDANCAKELVSKLKPGAKVKLTLWPADDCDQQPTDCPQVVEVFCRWESPYAALQASSFHCQGYDAAGRRFAYRVEGLPWSSQRVQREDLSRRQHNQLTPPVRPAFDLSRITVERNSCPSYAVA